MRTRRSNKSKRYTEHGFALTNDDGSAGEPSQAAHDGESDRNFGANNSDNDASPSDHDESDLYDDPAGLSDPGSDTGQAPRRKLNSPKAQQLAEASASAKEGIDYHELPVYPLDPRISTRAYTGPLKRGARANIMRDIMYGPEYSRVKLIWDLMQRWVRYPVLPARYPPQHAEGVLPSPWLPLGFELKQEKAACRWYAEYLTQYADVAKSHPMLPKNGKRVMPQAGGGLAVLLGPVENQKEYMFSQGAGNALCASSLPIDESDDPDQSPSGWLFDAGGIVVALGWAPILTGDKQVLALAVVPHSDQVQSMAAPNIAADDEKKNGSIQFWEFHWDRDQEGRQSPSRRPPKFALAKCFDWGRPKRMQWCPVPFSRVGLQGILALLCGDGHVRVLDVKAVKASETTAYEWVESPVATLGFTDNYRVEVTCFTWLGCNRIALGHTDGSITLWSIYPTQILQRHGVHASHVLDISSAYPSLPHMVASIPVGGFTTLVDLSSPTGECTYFNAPGIHFQPGNLAWNDHLQGWLLLTPSGGPGLNTLVFLNVRYFPVPKSMLTSSSAPMCLSFNGNHPYGLVGCADGSVWSFNALSRLFRQRGEDAFKIKVFEHEFRPTDAFSKAGAMPLDRDGIAGLRGASRFLQGFWPEVSDDPRSERLREHYRKKVNAGKMSGKGKKRGRPSRDAVAKPAPGADAEGDDAGGSMDDASPHMTSRIVIHEPLTRVSAIAWNPNIDFSTWMAAAVGSGLVRVMDVGVE